MIDAADRATGSLPDGVTRDLHKLRETAGRVVGSVFFAILLRQMRESGLKGEYGHGGRGEEVFSAQLHQIIAERMGMSGNNALTDALYRSYERQQRIISSGRFANEGPSSG